MKPGANAADVDEYVRRFAIDNNLTCVQNGYKGNLSEVGFPAHCCVSINEESCHGLPTSDKVFKDGDIVKVDVTFADKDNWHGDTCRTFVVGDYYHDLVSTARIALQCGIQAVKVGRPISDIGRAIEDYVSEKKYNIIKEFCGHSIGQHFHLSPQIPHYYDPDLADSNVIIKPGMMFTIEPIIVEDEPQIVLNENKWTIITEDGGWAAQFEHTIGIDEDGKVIVFTED